MKTSQEGFAHLILILIIAAIVAGGGYYLYTKQQGSASVSPSPRVEAKQKNLAILASIFYVPDENSSGSQLSKYKLFSLDFSGQETMLGEVFSGQYRATLFEDKIYFIDGTLGVSFFDVLDKSEGKLELPEIKRGNIASGVSDFYIDTDNSMIYYIRGDCDATSCQLYEYSLSQKSGHVINNSLKTINSGIFALLQIYKRVDGNLIILSHGGDGPCGSLVVYSVNLKNGAITKLDEAGSCGIENCAGASDVNVCMLETKKFDNLSRQYGDEFTFQCGSVTGVAKVGEVDVNTAKCAKVYQQTFFAGCI